MAFNANGDRRSRLAACVAAASAFLLSDAEATTVAEECTAVICDQFDEVCSALGVTEASKARLWRRSVANESVFYPLN